MPGIQAPPDYPEELTKYAKMLKMGVPASAVQGKMAADGFADDLYDKYLNPDTAITKQEAHDISDIEEDEKIEPSASIASHPPSNGFFSTQNFVPKPDSDSEVKMDTLQPVPVKKTLLIVNTFVVNTAAFLNKFVTTCESKLHKIHTDIQRMETTMLLLESKLASIDWLMQAEQGNVPVIPAPEAWETTEFKSENKNESDIKQVVPAPQTQPEPAAEQQTQQDPDPLLLDEEMKPFFKMLKFGVPEPSVRHKMSLSGVNDEIQDRIIQLGKGR